MSSASAAAASATRTSRQRPFDNTRWSKSLSQILRHGAHDAGIPITTDGYVYVDDILSHPRFRGLTEATVRTIVADCRKQRFALLNRDGRLVIKANQGHSLQIDDKTLTPVTLADVDQYPTVVHGTTREALALIRTSGLQRMGRLHIHMAVGLPGGTGVISGMRFRCAVHIYVDLPRALAAGIPFFISLNRVILSPGPIPPEFFARVDET